MKMLRVRLILLGDSQMTFKKMSRSLYSRQYLRDSWVDLHIWKTMNIEVELMDKLRGKKPEEYSLDKMQGRAL